MTREYYSEHTHTRTHRHAHTRARAFSRQTEEAKMQVTVRFFKRVPANQRVVHAARHGHEQTHGWCGWRLISLVHQVLQALQALQVLQVQPLRQNNAQRETCLERQTAQRPRTRLPFRMLPPHVTSPCYLPTLPCILHPLKLLLKKK